MVRVNHGLVSRISRQGDTTRRAHARSDKRRDAEKKVGGPRCGLTVAIIEINCMASWESSSELNAIVRFKAMDDLGAEVKRKILSDDPKRFYGILCAVKTSSRELAALNTIGATDGP